MRKPGGSRRDVHSTCRAIVDDFCRLSPSSITSAKVFGSPPPIRRASSQVSHSPTDTGVGVGCGVAVGVGTGVGVEQARSRQTAATKKGDRVNVLAFVLHSITTRITPLDWVLFLDARSPDRYHHQARQQQGKRADDQDGPGPGAYNRPGGSLVAGPLFPAGRGRWPWGELAELAGPSFLLPGNPSPVAGRAGASRWVSESALFIPAV